MTSYMRVALAALCVVAFACGDDDDATPPGSGILVDPTVGLTTSETGAQATFTVVLEAVPTATVTIGLSSSDPGEGAVSPTSLVFTPANWNAPQTVTVTGVDDADADGAVEYQIITAAAVSADPSYDGVDAPDVTVSNVDDETAGFMVTPTEGLRTTERGGQATFTIRLNSAPTADVTVGLSSSLESEGFVSPTNLTFTVENWDAPQLVTVTGVDDDVADGPIDYMVVTAPAVSDDPNYDTLDPADVTVTNVDDETAGVTTDPAAGLMTTESGGQSTFTIVLNAAPNADVTIALSSSDPGEGTVNTDAVTFTPMNWSAPQVITITGVDDELDDGAQPYSIVLAPAVSDDPSYNMLDADDVGVSNVDNDTAGVQVMPETGLMVTEAGGEDTFTIVLNSEPSADVTFDLSSADPDEASVSPASVTFTPANWNAPQTVTVTGEDDNLVDGNQTFTIVTAPATSGDAEYSGLDPADVTGANVDDDSAGVTVAPLSGLTVTEGGGEDTFTVVLNSEPTADVIIDLASSAPDEASVSPSSLTFTSMNWNAPQTVTVTGVDDDLIDGNQPFMIAVQAAMSADPDYMGVDGMDVAGSNTDDDSAGVTVMPTMGLLTTEAPGGTDTFTVVLNAVPTADVVIAVESNDVGEATVSPSTLTFTTTNWNGAQTVTVTGVDDSIADGDQPFTIRLLPATSADPEYSGIDAADVSGSNTDNDSAGITVDPTMGLATSEGGGSDTFEVFLNSQPSADVTIAVMSMTPGEVSVSTSELTFTTMNWASPQEVTVTGIEDSVADGGQPFTIDLAAAMSADAGYDGINPANVTGINADNDSAGITLDPAMPDLMVSEDATTDTFTVVLNSQPTANVTIPLTSLDTDEATVSPAMLVFTDTDWNSPQTVTVTGVNDDIADNAQSFTIDLGMPMSTDGSYSALNPPNVTGTNADNDSAGYTVDPTSGLMAFEGGMNATFTVVLNSQPTADVVIPVASLSSDVTVAPSSLTFTSVDWNGAKTVTVTAADDAVQDGNLPFTIDLGAATSTDPGYSGLEPSDVTGDAIDNDSAGFTVMPPSVTTSESGGTDSFTIVLTSQPTADVTIPVSTTSDEVMLSSSSVVLTPTDWDSGATVTVTGLDDAIADRDQVYTINLGVSSSMDPAYDMIDVDDVDGLNIDNDTAGVTITAPALLEVFEGGASGTFTVELNSEPMAAVDITVTLSEPGEAMPSASTLTFTAANWNVPQTVTITAVDDVIADGDVLFDISFATVTTDVDYGALIISDTVSAVARDDDAKGFSVVPQMVLSVTEAGSTDTFTVVLTAPPTADVTVAVSSNKPDEAVADTALLTFTTANWDLAQTVTVTGVDDAIADGDQTFLIQLAPAMSMDSDYDTLDPSDVAGLTLDDDADISVSDTSGLLTAEDGSTDDFLVVLEAQPAANVVISVQSSDTSEVTVSPMSLTFTPTDWDLPQMVTITGVDDSDLDGDIPFTITLTASGDPTYAALPPIDITGDNLDDEVAPTGGLVINEVDYDQPGSDAAEFVELYNSSSSAISLNGLAVVFVNGSGGAEYSRVTLPNMMLGAGEYFLIANAGVTVPTGVMSMTIADDSVQNGAPDGIAIIDTAGGTVLDALSYEGSVTAATITGITGTVSLVEGTAATASDPGAGSLIRSPDGADTDDADTDWSLTTTVTPGAANVAS
ncbi:MAG: lamin tail domain-containing protein [Myxococcota bacterium]